MIEGIKTIGKTRNFSASRFGLIVLISIAMLLSTKASAQCSVGSDDCYTYQETLSQFSSGSTKVVGVDVASNANFNFSSGEMLLVPSGQSFTGGITGNNHTNTMICVANGASFSPSYVNNFLGTIRNYSASLTIANSFGGNIENYNGTLTVNNNSQLSNGKYILNCDGTLLWNSSLNVNGGVVYNNGTLNIRDQVSGGGCIFNESQMIIGSSITNLTQQGYTGTISLYNNGLLSIPGEMQGQGIVVNQGWMTIGGYVGQNTFTNYGKVEVVGTKLYFNSSGSLDNYCSFFSNTSGAEFQNNQSINNFGLIYLPVGNWHNQNGTFFNGPTGVIRTQNLTNQSVVAGSGRFYVTGNSNNWNSAAHFGTDGGAINFYDASNTGNPGHFDQNTGTIGGNVFYTQFTMPEYSPDLSNYECGDIILAGSVQPGEIAASQVLCQGINPQPFTSVQDAWVDGGGAIIIYQWQSSTDNVNFYSISGANLNVYTVPSRPAVITYYRRRAKATYSGADSIKNAMNNSNVLTITPVDDPPPSITVNPTNVSTCYNTQAQFTATAQNIDSYLWQVLSTDPEAEWTDLSDIAPYSGSSTGTLTINPTTIGVNNYQYRLAASSNYCGTVYSTPATLTVLPPDKPSIIQQPANQMLCPSTNSATFNTNSSDSDINYQWEISTDGGANWTNITGENYTGAATRQLTVNEAGLNESHLYRCVLSAICDTAITHTARIYQVVPEVKVSSTPEIKCPDTITELGFNGLDSDYQMGNSEVVFVVQRLSEGPFDWSFSYELTLTNPDLLAENPPQTSNATINVDSADDEYVLVFYLENQTEDAVDLTLDLSGVSVEGCTESSEDNINHSATTTVRRMPAVGAFNAY